MFFSRKIKILILIIMDLGCILIANILAYLFLSPYVSINAMFFKAVVFLSIGLYLALGCAFHLFIRVNRYMSLKELVDITIVFALSAVVSITIFEYIEYSYSRRFVFLIFMISMIEIMSGRLLWRFLVEKKETYARRYSGEFKRTLIIGAGSAGKLLLHSFEQSVNSSDIKVVGLIDDHPDKQHVWIHGVKVLGPIKELAKIISDHQVEMITLAIPSLNPLQLNELLNELATLPVEVNSMPSIEEVARGNLTVSKMKKIDFVALLGREEVQLESQRLQEQLHNKCILVTGAGGSIGSEICRQVVKFQPEQLILLGHGENSVYQIQRELSTNSKESPLPILIPVIADIKNREQMFEIMQKYQPDLVYHAAAHKHVPLMEKNPEEALRNNVYGTLNVAEAAKHHGVQTFVMISTDKAVNPTNVMGASKRIAEMIVTGLYEEGKTRFSVVRFGNVLGSRGSVIPMFQEQIEQGEAITVTDFRMTRYFMTIPEASKLVLQSGSLAHGGEVFILDMGEPVKIVELARKMIHLSGYTSEQIAIQETGIRPGEKLYEELLVDKERKIEQVVEKIFIGNVCGFSLSEVRTFLVGIQALQGNQLIHEMIEFANLSSQ
ncbi:polysaccharide biosynthesis protein [Enterococcus ureasiticus]|uniref:Short-chain dehydrogenase n=1 Tax=Enterococcus ureasiticus TaxID=903984 RepID=A0A1E5GH43_9ENTE|nr:nucleoside-diphosphate sugar epimerase/dehydratase [Enterococcus ureasiticus]OEG11967.1 short-chain dehydrogenase [Enterococcus ureasiticus]